ncbi:hypothetical protein FGW37_13955 [Streptomyces rectiverticillatus]|uniref:hypothetical protein n=1 Tax=Streptomyces rectiverticillatus TaxID=173860 RepID=UPI0015C2CBD7|nr:hypothetical protein [Streptomyces rectiverticillatus]QLE72556.1 hypothetical protein FGW37_13955 [Streptomyces rectiverticillatus]
MLSEALTAAAAAGGTAVVQAAGTDAWTGLRERVAQWFGRGDETRERVELERLDRTAAALETAARSRETERARDRQEAVWQDRFETRLEGLAAGQREAAAGELKALVKEYGPPSQAAGQVSGNAFRGPTAFQVDDDNGRENRLGVQ